MRVPMLLCLGALCLGACVIVNPVVHEEDDEPADDDGPADDADGDDDGDPVAREGSFERPFGAADWLYEPIPDDPAIDPDSDAIVARLVDGKHALALHEFGIPFYRADASTPRLDETCVNSVEWGPCAAERFSPRPITPEMVPHAGSDGAMVVIDDSPSTGERVGRSVDGYWQYSYNDGAPRMTYGDISDLDGDGRGDTSTGSGLSRAAGIVRGFEVEALRIDHAMTFASLYCAVDRFRYPATKTDGKYDGADGVVEGSRIQLDPSLDPDDYALTPAERMIFVALQEYGAYNNDCAGAAIAFSWEDLPGAPGAIYEAAGLYDYYELSAIPWDRIRVLAEVDGP